MHLPFDLKFRNSNIETRNKYQYRMTKIRNKFGTFEFRILELFRIDPSGMLRPDFVLRIYLFHNESTPRRLLCNKAYAFSSLLRVGAISSGRSTTWIPASFRFFTLSFADPLPRSTILLAWENRIPSGAHAPAT